MRAFSPAPPTRSPRLERPALLPTGRDLNRSVDALHLTDVSDGATPRVCGEGGVSAKCRRHGALAAERLPGIVATSAHRLLAAGQFVGIDEEVDPAGGNVDGDAVAGLDAGAQAAFGSPGRDLTDPADRRPTRKTATRDQGAGGA